MPERKFPTAFAACFCMDVGVGVQREPGRVVSQHCGEGFHVYSVLQGQHGKCVWQRADGGQCHELNIGAGTLDRPIENVTATVLHEMVHLFNLQIGVQDTSRGGTYHNKRFREAAEAKDLRISYDSCIGWRITEPTEALIEFIISQGWDDIMMNRQEGFSVRGVGGPGAKGGITPPATGRTSSTRKVVCPCCGQSVRATKKVHILCGDCMVPMVEVWQHKSAQGRTLGGYFHLDIDRIF